MDRPAHEGISGWGAGAPKIRERLRRRCPELHCSAISTVHAVLDRHGLVTHTRRRRYRAEGTPLSRPSQPNELWCADYKGEFMLADRRYRAHLLDVCAPYSPRTVWRVIGRFMEQAQTLRAE